MTDDYDFVPGVGYAPWGPEPTEQIEAVSIPKVKRWRVWGRHFGGRAGTDWYAYPYEKYDRPDHQGFTGQLLGEPQVFDNWESAYAHADRQARAE
jgi:hypothetical protein